MVGKIIREYLESGNRKITVPGFGTFMRKEPDEIIFVDLLRRDDGVLRGLVGDYGNYSEVEAMALVDRFIFEVKHGIEKNGSAVIADLGAMTLDDKGIYQFNLILSPVQPGTGTAVRKPQPGDEAPHADRQRPPVATRAQASRTPSPPKRPAPQNRQASPEKPKGRRPKPDTIILAAVIAAVIAIIIIIYGTSGSGLPFLG